MAAKQPSKIRLPEPLSKAPGLLWEGWSNSEVFRKYQIQELQEDIARVNALCVERQIQPGSTMYLELALQLVREAYPETQKSGRTKVWNDLTLGALVVELDRYIESRKTKPSIKSACVILAKKQPWATFLRTRILNEGKELARTSPDPGEVLRKKYYSFCEDPKANVMRNVYQLHLLEGTTDEWDRFVGDLLINPVLKKSGKKY